MNFHTRATLLVVLSGALAGCAGGARREPENLSNAKAAVIRYYDSGDYERGLTAVAKSAGDWIEERAAKRLPGERLVVVLDVDETALSNWENMQRQDFGYVSEAWHAWVDRGEAKAITPVKALYERVRRAEVAVIFLTGRKERDRSGTERNLKNEGMGDYARLIVKAESGPGTGSWKSAVEFKSEMRRRLLAEGWTIIANVGDQESDLKGGYAEKNFKLPNPFYITE